MKRVISSLAGLALFMAAAGVARAQERPVASTTSGPVRGVIEDGASVYRGIPFAASAAGEGRWAPPRPPQPWIEPRDAADYGPICVQGARPDGIPAAGGGRPQSEDCLSLNIFSPRGAKSAPVMVWIHGGAHRFGSGAGPIYDGGAFARDGVVLVTLNYRLGAFGYFAHPALTRAAKPTEPLASYGLMDQMAGLDWVRKNIAAFGGDPRNVTVFGESAGGASILALLATPSAKGLFDKAIVESGGGWQPAPGLAEEEVRGVAMASAAGLSGADATVAQLRGLPVDKLIVSGGGAGAIGPVADGRLLKESPGKAFAAGRAIDVPLIIGSNSFEASLMRAFPIPPAVALGRLKPEQRALYLTEGVTPEAAAQAAYTDVVMGAPARWVAARASGGAPSWLYHFSYVATAQRDRVPGAAHGAEIIYVFGTGSKLAGRMITEEDRGMEALIHACWVAFARDGRPACGGKSWPAYTPAEDRLMEFGVQSDVRQGFRQPFMKAAEAAAGY